MSNINRLYSKRENKFSVNSLINIYLYFEHLNWEESKNNLNEQYKAEIEKEKLDKINEFFKDYDKDNDKLIKKEYLAAALRRFIFRYLSGKRSDVDISETQGLIAQLTRNDLWKLNLTDDQERFNSELYQLSFDLKVNQAYEYYNLLGGDKLDTNFEKCENDLKENNEININQTTEEINTDMVNNNEDNGNINDGENNENKNNIIIDGEENVNNNENANNNDNNSDEGEDDDDDISDKDQDDNDDNDDEISC